MEKVQPEETPKEKKARIPFGAQRSKGVVANTDPAFVYRWVNDHPPGRIKQALEGGYQLVNSKEVIIGEGKGDLKSLGLMKSQHAGYDQANKPFKRYLMAIRRELYEEDQATKQLVVDEVDKAIRSGKFKNTVESDKAYAPSKIDIQVSTG